MEPPRIRAGARGPSAVYWTPLLVLVLSLIASALAAYFIGLTSRERDRVRFRTAMRSTTEVIRERLDIYSSVLRGGAAFFATQDAVTREEFKTYAERLDLQDTYPGIQGIGLAQRVRAADKERFLQAQRQADPGFEIVPPGERPDYYPIVWLEPLDRRNRQAIGYDMFGEPVRREAMARARDEGEPMACGKVTLVQEIDPVKQPGFLLYVALYEGGRIPPIVEERREKIYGFVYSPFRADDLFQGIFGEAGTPDLHFEVYDGDRVAPENLLHRSPLRLSDDPAAAQTVPLVFAGHRWTLLFRSTPEFEAGSYTTLLPWVIAAGLLLSVALCAITAALARAHHELHLAQEQLKGHAGRLEQAVAERTAALRETISELEHMSYSIVHDMRAPLRAIQSFGGLLEEEAGPALNPTGRDFVHRMKTAASRMDALIRDILNYGKLVRQELPLQRVDVAHLLRGIVETYPAFTPDKAEIRIEPLPPVLGNEAALTQCFSNLLSNAVKYAKPGQKPLVHISGQRQDGSVVITVADNGIGIPKELQGKIFGLFQRLETSQESTGIGLAIVRKATERMGGSVSVDSQPGEGSRFRLELRPAD